MTENKPALKALYDMYQNQNFLILDTETTGLRDGEICSIALIDCRGFCILDTLVKTVGPIPADATSIHGITDDMVKDSPTWCDLAPALIDMITGHDVVIYNAVYDRKMMHKSAERHGMDKIDWKTISPFYCAMDAFAEFYGDWNAYHQSYTWKSLTIAARFFRAPTDNAHNALSDCKMTLAVVDGMVAAINQEGGWNVFHKD